MTMKIGSVASHCRERGSDLYPDLVHSDQSLTTEETTRGDDACKKCTIILTH